jgi:hypothetical protein
VLIRKAARITTFSRFDAHHKTLFQELKWKSFSETLREESVKYIFKSMNGMASKESTSYFKKAKHS